ncbi:MAG: hypothetical protein HY077_02665 [Elusimicrobia bacterium]|nr:hypothetical protein [Elusimicrobiota bacterium]
MLDISGSSAPSPAPQGGTPHPGDAARGQRLWAVLLVLDAFFVILFGGALAANVYQHLQAPAPPASSRRSRAAKPPEPAKPVESAKPPAPAPRSMPARPAKTDQVKPPKPSLLNEPPRHEAAKPREMGRAKERAPAPAAPPAAAAAAKAVPVDFSLKAPGAKRVELAGPFIVRGGGRMAMKDRGEGQWSVTLYLTPNTYRYHFLVDGKKTLDPQNPKTDRNASVVTVP